MYNNNDAEALAPLFTEDAVLVPDSGLFTVGRDREILKYQKDVVRGFQPNHPARLIRILLHVTYVGTGGQAYGAH